MVRSIIDTAADTSTSGAEGDALADELREEFVRNVLVIRGGEYLYLLAEDKDVA